MTNAPLKIGLALGGGGARGLAHIKILQVLDEFQIKPQKITGTSMGALVGSLYAAGMSGDDLELYAKDLFHKRTELLKRLYGNRPASWSSLINLKTPAILDAETFFEMFMPEQLPKTFEELEIPFAAIAADFYMQQQTVIDSGPILPAIAASSALPALLKPVKLNGKVLIDGGFVNPVPYNVMQEKDLFIIAIDVTGEPDRFVGKRPSSINALIGCSQIMLRSLTNAMLEVQRPNILIQPKVGRYNVLDYFKIDDILADSETAADELRRELDKKLTVKAELV